MNIIECRKLVKLYSDQSEPALKGIDLSIKENIVFGFLGPNGAGKTTTIKILTGLMRFDSGEVIIDGEYIRSNNVNFKNKIGYLGQDQKLFSWMTGKELLIFTAKLFGQSNTRARDSAMYFLNLSGLKEACEKKISNYSGGMVQRLGIAQALIGKPKLLFLDEPTSALDPIGRKEVLEFIDTIKGECTVFMSTHILSDVEKVCDSIAIINKGQIVEYGEKEKLKNKYSVKMYEVSFTNEEAAIRFENICKTVDFINILETKELCYKLNVKNLETKEGDFTLIKFLIYNDLNIKLYRELEPSIEDIFIKLTESN